MSKTSETLFPGEYSQPEAMQNLNDLVRKSSFVAEAFELAIGFEENIKTTLIEIDAIDAMSNVFTLCNDYETRYQAIIKKALDQALAKVRAKNDLQEVTWEFPTGSSECIGGIVIDAKTETHKKFIDSDGKPTQDFTPVCDLEEPK